MQTTIKKFDADTLLKVSEILKAIAHPIRLQVLEALMEHKTLTVTDLKDMTQTEQSLLSNHLIKMKDRGLLRSVRKGKNIFYELVDENILKIFACIENCELLL